MATVSLHTFHRIVHFFSMFYIFQKFYKIFSPSQGDITLFSFPPTTFCKKY